MPLHYETDGTVSMQIAVSSSAPSTVTLSCYNKEAATLPALHAYAQNSQIDAIQTSSNS